MTHNREYVVTVATLLLDVGFITVFEGREGQLVSWVTSEGGVRCTSYSHMHQIVSHPA